MVLAVALTAIWLETFSSVLFTAAVFGFYKKNAQHSYVCYQTTVQFKHSPVSIFFFFFLLYLVLYFSTHFIGNEWSATVNIQQRVSVCQFVCLSFHSFHLIFSLTLRFHWQAKSKRGERLFIEWCFNLFFFLTICFFSFFPLGAERKAFRERQWRRFCWHESASSPAANRWS